MTDVEYVRRGELPLKADLLRPGGKGPFPVVLVIHGGGWAQGDKSQIGGIARLLANRGFGVMTIDYRLAPRFTYPAQLEDCRAALVWLRKEGPGYDFDTTRIGVWGFSAGAQLAAMLATTDAAEPQSGIRAAVLASAPTNLEPLSRIGIVRRYIGGDADEKRDLYRDASPIRHVGPRTAPIFMFHGALDTLLPIAQSEAMKKALDDARVPAVLHRVEDAGHGGFTPGIRAAVKDAVFFLDHWLKLDIPSQRLEYGKP